MRGNLVAALAALGVVGCTLYADLPGGPDADPEDGARPVPNPPELAPVVVQRDPPPPLSGGTLAVSAAGDYAVAADPDRAEVHVVDLASLGVRTVKVDPRDEPGRVAFGERGLAWVVMRRSGDLVALDVQNARISVRAHACVSPRGVAVDAGTGDVWVACAEGTIAVFTSEGRRLRARAAPEWSDLRDIVLEADRVYVSRFRAAEVVTVGRDLVEIGRASNPGTDVAWRMAARPRPPHVGPTEARPEGPLLVAQEVTDPSGGAAYYSEVDADAAGRTVGATVSSPGRAPLALPLAVLPVDLAVARDRVAVVAAGNGHTRALPQVFVAPIEDSGRSLGEPVGLYLPGQAVAAAFTPAGQLLVQSREPAQLLVVERGAAHRAATLSTSSREDTGWAVFHSNSGGNVACASCHPEGGDDGRVWRLPTGNVRTPSLQGTVAGTAPLHWKGEVSDAYALVHSVFTTRMRGPTLKAAQLDAAVRWLEAIPRPNRLRDREHVPERGAAVFAARCASCHAGPRYTNNQTMDLGRLEPSQVPSLIGVAWRLPLRHDGCAVTLADRFWLCADSAHDAKALGPEDLAAVLGFLESL